MKTMFIHLTCRMILCAVFFVTTVSHVLAFAETDSLSANELSKRLLKALNSNVAPVGNTFTEVASLTGVLYGDVAWGDYDNDNDLDLIVTGGITDPNDPANLGFAKLYKNNAGVFIEDFNSTLEQLYHGAADWGDYDRDGDIDLVLTGLDPADRVRATTFVYNNANGILTKLSNAPMTGAYKANCKWIDFDNDGFLDIHVTGWTAPAANTVTTISRFFRNNGASFELAQPNFPPLHEGDIAFADIDGDRDLDIFMTGGVDYSALWLAQTPLSFQQSGSFDGLSNSAAVWGDFDNDGDQDLILSGTKNNSGVGTVHLYKNNGGTLTSVGASGLQGHYESSIATGDYDNDGDLDILLTGFTAPISSTNTNLYTNDGTGNFTLATNTGLTTAVRGGRAKFGDYDNDGDLDVVVIGSNSARNTFYCKIYRNDLNATNAAPATPTGLTSVQTGSDVVFSWNAATDAQGGKVSYNLRLGTTPGGDEIMGTSSDDATGYHRIAKPGNVGNSLSWKIKNLGGLNYYWSVQAIDNSLKAGSFATEKMTTTVYPPGNFKAEASNQKVTLTWLNGNVNGYNIIYRENAPTSNPTNVLVANTTGTSYTDTGLQNGAIYYYYIKAVDNDGNSADLRSANAKPEYFAVVATFPVNQYGAAAWGDYDSDGDYDIVVTGNDYPNPSHMKFYTNTNGVFTETIGVSLNSGNLTHVSFADYDNDNDLDLLHTGIGEPATTLFKNTGGTFSVVANANLPEAQGLKHAWADFDNDGDLDLAVPGFDKKIFLKNTKADFSSAGELPSTLSLEWADYDNDGDMDFATREGIFSNTNGVFTKVVSAATGTVAWADIDNDRDLDLITTGITSGATAKAVIYRNDGATFAPVEQPQIFAAYTGDILGVSISPGDYDNDGDIDLLVAQSISFSPYFTRAAVYVNNGSGTFTKDEKLVLPQASSRCVTWGDYDRDGDLDILFYGWDFANGNDTWNNKVYRNNLNVPNTAPTVPSNLQATMSDSKITFTWDASTDTQGGPITYNLRVGTTPGGSEIMSAMANSSTGQLLLPQMGNVQLNRSWKLNGITAGNYYWSVQAIDGAFVSSAFATEKQITLASQTITFNELSAVTMNQAPFNVTASSSSALPVTFTSSNPAVATVNGNQITVVAVGTTNITASQPGNNSFAAATPVMRVLTVTKVDQTITFSTLNPKTVGDAAFTPVATASSGLAVTFSTTSDKVTLAGNAVTIVKAGSVTLTGNQAGNATYNAAPAATLTFCINPAKPSISMSGVDTENILLTSTASEGNQWYLDGAAISSATQTTLKPLAPGKYTVKVTVDNCSSVLSDQTSLIVTGVEESFKSKIRLYPNPATTHVTVEFPSDGNLNTLELLPSDGRNSLQTLETTRSSVELDVHELPSGLYIIRLSRLGKVEHRKFVKR